MKIVSQLDADGFFMSAVAADKSPLEDGVFLIPAAAIDVPPPEFEAKIHHKIKWDGGQFIEVENAKPAEPELQAGETLQFNEVAWDWIVLPAQPTTAQLIAAKRAEINAAFEQVMQQITNGYPSNEVLSWAKQEAEARAYQANNAAATPLIDALASSRGINKAELVTRIIAKTDLFAEVSGALIGKRQSLEDALDALDETATAEDVAAIVW